MELSIQSLDATTSRNNVDTANPKVAAPDVPITVPNNQTIRRKSWRFWIAFFTLCVCAFMSSIDATILATALPPIAHELKGSSLLAFWCATSFLLAQTVIQPSIISPHLRHAKSSLRKFFRDIREEECSSCRYCRFPDRFDFVCSKHIDGNACCKSHDSRHWGRGIAYLGGSYNDRYDSNCRKRRIHGINCACLGYRNSHW